MNGEKRRKVVLSSLSYKISESPSIGTFTTSSKPILYTGKENVPPLLISEKGNCVINEAFHQTDIRRYPPAHTQIKHDPLSVIHSVSGFDSTGLDELDSEILESSGLAELDAEIFETTYVSELDSEIPEKSGVTELDSKFFREPEYKTLNCDVYGVGLRESRSIESRLVSSLSSRNEDGKGGDNSGIDDEDADVVDDEDEEDFESTQFDVLMKLCEGENEFSCNETGPIMACPLCGIDISEMNEESRHFHANECIDKPVAPKDTSIDAIKKSSQSSHAPLQQCSEKSPTVTPVMKWLQSLDLAKYERVFIEQEIDWESLQWLTEKDLITMGVTALGPRKKILQSIQELKKSESSSTEQRTGGSEHKTDPAKSIPMNKLITDFFASPFSHKKKTLTSSGQQQGGKEKSDSLPRQVTVRKTVNGNRKDIPPWCTVPGTSFRVDAFRYLRRDCSHWFLTHFHIDHYQGLTKSFSYGKIYCSMITARLINTKIGIPWDKLQVMPLKQKINIFGIDVTCYDANHCPGAIMLLFKPLNGEPVLHTGDFRFNEGMSTIPDLQRCHIHTLILDTTYCNPQYNFPKQEEVMQFVIEAIQAESFNPKTLFLFGSYTIGKEKLFLEVAHVLKRKIYVPIAKLRLLECLDLPAEDMQWLTPNENESNIHVVPMWSIASFKRLKQLSYQYTRRFSLIIAFSPTGWTLGKGKKSAGRKRQQGTIIRYEVPYSEHCSFEELKEFVSLLSPVKIIPSVNNEGENSSNTMTELLLS